MEKLYETNCYLGYSAEAIREISGALENLCMQTLSRSFYRMKIDAEMMNVVTAEEFDLLLLLLLQVQCRKGSGDDAFSLLSISAALKVFITLVLS